MFDIARNWVDNPLGMLYIQPMTSSDASPLQVEATRIVDTCLANRTRRLSRVITRLYNDRLRPVGINVAEMNLLVAIAALGSVQPAQLSRALEIEKSTLSRNLKRLAERGWITTRDNPEGRGELVGVTQAGEEVLDRAIPAWEDAQRRAATLVGEATIPTITRGEVAT